MHPTKQQVPEGPFAALCLSQTADTGRPASGRLAVRWGRGRGVAVTFCAVQHGDIAACTACGLCVLMVGGGVSAAAGASGQNVAAACV